MGRYTHRHRALSRAIRRHLSIAALAALLAAPAAWASTYRWVDERGGVHYGDTLPPQYTNRGHVELNAQGRVIRRIEPAPATADERARQAQEQAHKETVAREALERQRRDNALLATYGSVQEIDAARARTLTQEQALLDNLLALRRHTTSPAELERIDGMLAERRRSLTEAGARYDADRARYIVLTAGR